MPELLDEQKTSEVKPDFDKEKQRADQAEANFRKEREQREAMQANLEAQVAESNRLKQQLEELSAQVNAKKSVENELPEIDVENASVEELAHALARTRKLIVDQTKKIATLETVASAVKKNSEATEAQQREAGRKQKILNELCDDLEAEYGKGLRNEAIELMQKKNDELGLPTSPAMAARRLEKCFKEIADSKKGKKKNDTRDPLVDPGHGGGRPRYGTMKLKKGSLDDVADQIATATSG